MPYINKNNPQLFSEIWNQWGENGVQVDCKAPSENQKLKENYQEFSGEDQWEIDTEEELKRKIQQAKDIRDTAINEITNAKLLDDLQVSAGMITQAVYDTRQTARLAQLTTVQNTFYATTSLPRPTVITA